MGKRRLRHRLHDGKRRQGHIVPEHLQIRKFRTACALTKGSTFFNSFYIPAIAVAHERRGRACALLCPSRNPGGTSRTWFMVALRLGSIGPCAVASRRGAGLSSFASEAWLRSAACGCAAACCCGSDSEPCACSTAATIAALRCTGDCGACAACSSVLHR